MGMAGQMNRATAEEIDAWVAKCHHNLRSRAPDPVEASERNAHFKAPLSPDLPPDKTAKALYDAYYIHMKKPQAR
jgi:hypothetical protein